MLNWLMHCTVHSANTFSSFFVTFYFSKYHFNSFGTMKEGGGYEKKFSCLVTMKCKSKERKSSQNGKKKNSIQKRV